MLRSTIRLAPRRVLTSSKISSVSSTRFLSTAPPAAKSRSWKSTFARWGIAIGGIYWYNTSPSFAEEPLEASIAKLEESIHDVRESSLPTLDAILEEKKHRNLEEAERLRRAQREEYLAQRREYIAANPESAEAQEAASAQEADEDAPPQAFNPETGEINWDCPCLGGMAHGPCGEEFKAAFSCFVFSKEEPKGIECIEKFKVMQTCIRAHPEMYPDREEEDEVEEELLARERVQDGKSAESRKIDEVTETTGVSRPNSSQPSKPTPNPYTSGSTPPTTAYSSDKPAEALVHNAAIDVANQK